MYGYIYMIINKINGKTYIGQRKFNGEWYEDKYMGSGKKLASAKKHYGIESFEKFLVQYCNSKDELNKQEIFWLSEYRKRGKAEYNIANGGDGGNWGQGFKKGHEPFCGNTGHHYRHTEEAKRKMRETNNKGKFEKGHIPWSKGKHLSEETKKKISEKMKRNNTNKVGE